MDGRVEGLLLGNTVGLDVGELVLTEGDTVGYSVPGSEIAVKEPNAFVFVVVTAP